jgi:hypothetical protein
MWQQMITVHWTRTKNLGNKQTKKVDNTTKQGLVLDRERAEGRSRTR